MWSNTNADPDSSQQLNGEQLQTFNTWTLYLFAFSIRHSSKNILEIAWRYILLSVLDIKVEHIVHFFRRITEKLFTRLKPEWDKYTCDVTSYLIKAEEKGMDKARLAACNYPVLSLQHQRWRIHSKAMSSHFMSHIICLLGKLIPFDSNSADMIYLLTKIAQHSTDYR